MTFTSYAQNFEDVLLWRALSHVQGGFYIDAGAAHPDIDSVTRAFYDRGWSGINVEPVEAFARRLEACRPRDITLRVALGERPGRADFYVVGGTGLSSLERQVVDGYGDTGFAVERTEVAVETLEAICRRHAPADIHFLKIDVEGSERAVLAGADFAAFRPWIVLVEATAPMSTTETHAAWEPMLLDAGYRFVWFDGLNRFYVAAERHAALAAHFRTPPNVFDDFVRVADTDWARRISEAETRAAGLLDRAIAAESHAQAAESRAEAATSHAGTVEQRAEAAYLRLAEETRNTSLLRSLADSRGHEIDRLHAAIAEVEARVRESTEWLAAMRRSTSWRLTAPLRLVANMVGELRARGVPAPAPQPRPADPVAPNPPAAGPSPPPIALAGPPSPLPRLAGRRVVHQFHSGSAVGDAITNSMLLIRRLLRELGYVSDIFVEHRDPKLVDTLRHIDELPQHDRYVLIVHHSMGFDAFPRVAELAAPKVLLYHNITPVEFFPGSPVLQHYSRLGRAQLADWRPRVAAALADSDYNAIELRRLGFAAVQSCMLLFDMAELRATAAQFARTGADATFTILFVGRVTQSKGQSELIAAYAAFRARFDRPSRLVIVGRHEGAGHAYLQELQARIDANGLGSHVLLTGLATDEELHGWYAAADLYVSLSQHEGFSVPLIEAMVHGVPVLAWPSSAVPYTLGDAAELLEDRAPEAVAARMLELANDPARRASIVQRQYARLDRFTLQRQIPALVQALALAGAAPPPADAPTRETLAANMRFTIVGHVNKNYSLAAINRSLALALEAERPGRVRVVPVETLPTADLSEVPLPQRAALTDLASRPGSVTGPEIVISHHYPVHVPAAPGDAALALFFWEESLVPPDTVALLNRSFRGVLSPSCFVTKALIDSGLSIPVRTIGFAPDLAAFRRLVRDAPKPAGRFTFLHVSSCFPRKGVDALLAAYAGAFRRGDAVRLVIKGFANPHNQVAAQIAQLREADAEAPEIVLIDRDMAEPELLELYAEADAMVLPTRGEGFNIPAAEAMAAEIPLIVTGFGGQMDFCNPAVARLLDYRFAVSQSHLATAHSVWIEPVVEDLAAAMRELVAARDPGAAAPLLERTRRAAAASEALGDRGAMVRRLTDAALDLLLAPPREKLRIAWISTWSIRCGIAEYSRHLFDNLPADDAVGEIMIVADKRTETVAGDRRVLLGWELGNPGNARDLAAMLAAQDPQIVVLQHQPGLFSWGVLAELLGASALAGRVVTVTLHNTRNLLDTGAEERGRAVAGLAGVTRVIVHTVADLNLLKSLGLVANVTMMPQGAPAGLPPNPPRPLTPADAPLIGCYGFFLPNKGIGQLIEAVAILRRRWPGARLRLVNAEYGVPESAAEIAACRATAKACGLDPAAGLGAVEWVTDFLPQERSLALLAECDVVALPYQASTEASSAALRTALSAGAPVMVTPLALFDEAGDACARCAGNDPAAIAEGLGALLEDRERRLRTQAAAQRWLAEREWGAIAQRMQGMLLGLAAQQETTGHGAPCTPPY